MAHKKWGGMGLYAALQSPAYGDRPDAVERALYWLNHIHGVGRIFDGKQRQPRFLSHRRHDPGTVQPGAAHAAPLADDVSESSEKGNRTMKATLPSQGHRASATRWKKGRDA